MLIIILLQETKTSKNDFQLDVYERSKAFKFIALYK